MNKTTLISVFLFCIALATTAQEKETEAVADSLQTELAEQGVVIEDLKAYKRATDPLSPSKAAFYSAMVPGLGQAYNRKYWKIPIVYAALGVGVYAYKYNDDLYDRFRTAFKRRRAGFTDDEFYDINDNNPPGSDPDLSDEALQDGQERYQRDRDLSLLVTIGLYALQVIDANVDAHLQQYNVSEDLTFDIHPYLGQNPVTSNLNYGVTFTFKF